jgi:hypothetical protein
LDITRLPAGEADRWFDPAWLVAGGPNLEGGHSVAYPCAMRAQNVDAVIAEDQGEDAPFEMANFYPRDTGLPMTVWVSPKGNARHDVRIKVCMTPGDRMDATNTAVVAARPEPRVVHGELAPKDFDAVARWIGMNEPALVDYWNGELSTVELVRQLRRI